MAVYTRGKKRNILTYVEVYTNLLYGFKTKDLSALAGVSEGDLTTQLGHLVGAFTAPSGSIKILGANAPKPARVKKNLANAGAGAQQSVSTFCATAKYSAAMAAGWDVIKQRRGVTIRPETSTKNSVTAIATLSDTSCYCFPMNKADFSTYKAALGLQSIGDFGSVTETEIAKFVSGSSIPRPGKASIEVSGGGTFSSFYSTANKDDLATAGFNILSDEFIFAIVITP